MCPACLATTALIVASGTAAGGLVALVVKKFRQKRNTKNIHAKSKIKEKSL